MAVPLSPRLGLVFALGWEFRPLRRHIRFLRQTKRRLAGRAVPFLYGDEVVAAVAGVGTRHAACAAEALLDRDHVSGVVCAGLAGALSQDLTTGDIVVASHTLTPSASYASDATWHDLALSLGREDERVVSGRLFTSDRVITRATEKHRLAMTYDATAVDMESAGAAEIAHACGRPFLAIRVISDDAHTDLPEAVGRWARGGGRAVPSPREAVELVRLGLHARVAARRLAVFVTRFVGATST